MGAPGTPPPDPTGAGAGPTPGPPAGGAPPGGGPPPEAGAGGPPSQAPGTPEQRMLATLYQACKGLAQQNPAMAPGLAKAAEGIQEAQSALLTQPSQGQGPSPQQSPPL